MIIAARGHYNIYIDPHILLYYMHVLLWLQLCTTISLCVMIVAL